MKDIEKTTKELQSSYKEGEPLESILKKLSNTKLTVLQQIVVLSKVLEVDTGKARDIILKPYKNKLSDMLLDSFLSEEE